VRKLLLIATPTADVAQGRCGRSVKLGPSPPPSSSTLDRRTRQAAGDTAKRAPLATYADGAESPDPSVAHALAGSATLHDRPSEKRDEQGRG